MLQNYKGVMMGGTRYRSDYSGLAYSGGGSLANIGAGLLGGAMAQDERNLAQNAKNRAFKLEESKNELAANALELNRKTQEDAKIDLDRKFDLAKTVHEDARMDLLKKDAAKEALRKSNISSMRKFLEENYKIDTSKMSDDDISFNGERLEKIYQDKTNRKTPKFFSTSSGVVAVYSDENGKPITKVVFDAPTKENKAKVAKTDGYIQLPSYLSGEESDKYQSKIGFDGIPGTWVTKDEWATMEAAKKKGNMDVEIGSD